MAPPKVAEILPWAAAGICRMERRVRGLNLRREAAHRGHINYLMQLDRRRLESESLPKDLLLSNACERLTVSSDVQGWSDAVMSYPLA